MARSARPVVLLAVMAVLAGCTGPGLDKAGGTQARQPVVLTLASFMRNGKCAHQRNRRLLSIVSNVVRNASLGEALLVQHAARGRLAEIHDQAGHRSPRPAPPEQIGSQADRDDADSEVMSL